MNKDKETTTKNKIGLWWHRLDFVVATIGLLWAEFWYRRERD